MRKLLRCLIHCLLFLKRCWWLMGRSLWSADWGRKNSDLIYIQCCWACRDHPKMGSYIAPFWTPLKNRVKGKFSQRTEIWALHLVVHLTGRRDVQKFGSTSVHGRPIWHQWRLYTGSATRTSSYQGWPACCHWQCSICQQQRPTMNPYMVPFIPWWLRG